MKILKTTILTALIGIVGIVPATHAAAIAVTTTSDTLSSSDKFCSLREAIINTNSNSTIYADCWPTGSYGDDTIRLPEGTYQLTASDEADDLSVTGDLDILDNLTITGSGADNTIISAESLTDSDGNGARDRVMEVINAVVVLNSMTLTGATTDEFGGGLSVHSGIADVTLNSVNVTHNSLSGGTTMYGAGISCSGATLTLADSEISSNTITTNSSSRGSGVGLYLVDCPLTATHTNIHDNIGNGTVLGGGICASSSVTLDSVGIYNNSLPNDSPSSVTGGSGLYVTSGSVNITNSTISDNSANASAVYINSFYSSGTFSSKIDHTTISNNASTGSEIWNSGVYIANNSTSTVAIKNSVIADNYNTSGSYDLLCYSPTQVESYGYNLVENSNCTLSYTLSGADAATDLIGSDALIGSLSDNGGETDTVPPLESSPIIGSGSCTDIDGNPVTADQRDYVRGTDNCDRGAYESDGINGASDTSESTGSTDTGSDTTDSETTGTDTSEDSGGSTSSTDSTGTSDGTQLQSNLDTSTSSSGGCSLEQNVAVANSSSMITMLIGLGVLSIARQIKSKS